MVILWLISDEAPEMSVAGHPRRRRAKHGPPAAAPLARTLRSHPSCVGTGAMADQQVLLWPETYSVPQSEYGWGIIASTPETRWSKQLASLGKERDEADLEALFEVFTVLAPSIARGLQAGKGTPEAWGAGLLSTSVRMLIVNLTRSSWSTPPGPDPHE